MTQAMDVEIRSNDWRAVVSPARGGQLCSLSSQENGRRRNWIKTLESGEHGHFGGGHVTVEAPGQGPMPHPEGPPIGWPDIGPCPSLVPWQLARSTPERVELLYRHCSRSPGESAYQLGQSLTLAPQRLSMTVSMCNLGPYPLIRRLGWQLRLPDEFSFQISLDPEEPTLRRPSRGHLTQCVGWPGRALLSTLDGRCLELNAEGGIHTVTALRHLGRPGVTLRLMTADIPTLTPLERGEEWRLALSLTLTAPAGTTAPTGRSSSIASTTPTSSATSATSAASVGSVESAAPATSPSSSSA
ncbi:hypothetical protein [Roseateles amylovorans]|uniref:HutD family protein n=1 Tax=Roseateles amylovorans TaxID=2978473 RepID=A0ABY6B048_9BURK|nr:hypothetical protein [Roseateles amylovorans]UXH78317.1 hypothetical protein N4261_25775 [Roseateles amylovorans]